MNIYLFIHNTVANASTGFEWLPPQLRLPPSPTLLRRPPKIPKKIILADLRLSGVLLVLRQRR